MPRRYGKSTRERLAAAVAMLFACIFGAYFSDYVPLFDFKIEVIIMKKFAIPAIIISSMLFFSTESVFSDSCIIPDKYICVKYVNYEKSYASATCRKFHNSIFTQARRHHALATNTSLHDADKP